MPALQEFPFERFADIIESPDKNWERFARKMRTADDALPQLVAAPMLTRVVENFGGLEADVSVTLKKALVLLHQSLGDEMMAKFFRIQQLETIASVIPMVWFTEVPAEDSPYRVVDLRLSILCMVVERLCRQCGGRDPVRMLYAILNELPLPYNCHLFLINQIQGGLADIDITLH